MLGLKLRLVAWASMSVLAGAIATPTLAQQTAPAAFDIPAGDLDTALRDLSRRTGVNIVYSTGAVRGRRATAVRGATTATGALRQMLRGTDVTFAPAQDGSITLSPLARSTSSPARTSQGDIVTPQTASIPQDDTATELEEVIVIGAYARSLATATEAKRRSEVIQDSISAEDVGDFPARNVGEALARVPGITLDRGSATGGSAGSRGESIFVNLRGLPGNFQLVQLNGRNIAVSENVETSAQVGRSFRFDILSPELIGRVDVLKTPVASVAEGGIAGSIDVRTYRPLDLGDQSRFAARLNYNDLADDGGAGLVGLKSWTNADETFGLLVSASLSDRRERQDSDFMSGWTLAENLSVAANRTAFPGTYLPATVRPTLELYRHERSSVSGTAQYRPNDDFETIIDVLASRQLGNYSSAGLQFNLQARPLDVASARIVDGALIAASAPNGQIAVTSEISKQRNDLYSIGLNQAWTPGDWRFVLDANASHTDARTLVPISRAEFSANGPIAFDFSGGVGSIPDLTTTLDVNNTATPFAGSGALLRRIERAKMSLENARFDVSRRLDGLFNDVSGGVSYESLDRIYYRMDRTSTRFTGALASATPGLLIPLTADDAFRNSDGAFARTWLVPNTEQVFQTYFDEGLLNTPQTAADLSASSHINERTLAAYVVGSFGFDVAALPVSGNLGLRVIETTQLTEGHANAGALGAVPITDERSYTEWLPSLNVKVDLRDDLVLRLAAARQISRPQLERLAPGLTVTLGAGVGRGGNPALEPFRANNYDASLEWYFGGGRLTAAGFVKDFDSYHTQSISRLVIDNPYGIEFYDITTLVNGGSATLRGFELTYQQAFTFLPEPFSGLGIEAALTRIYQEASFDVTSGTGVRPVEDQLLGVSPTSFNIVAFYERGRVSSRLGYSWRDAYLNANRALGGTDTYQDAYGSLDGSFSFDVNDRLSFTADAINLTDESLTAIARTEAGRDLKGAVGAFGRTFSIGVRARF